MKSIIVLIVMFLATQSYASEWTCFRDGKEVFKASLTDKATTATLYDDQHYSDVSLKGSKGSEMTGTFEQGHDYFDYVVTFNANKTISIQKNFFIDCLGDGEELEILLCEVK